MSMKNLTQQVGCQLIKAFLSTDLYADPYCIECSDQLSDEDRFEGLCDKCAKKEGILE